MLNRCGNDGGEHVCDLDIISHIQVADTCAPKFQRKLTLFSLSFLVFNSFIFFNLCQTDMLTAGATMFVIWIS